MHRIVIIEFSIHLGGYLGVILTRTENWSGTAGRPFIRNGGISNDSTSSGAGMGLIVLTSLYLVLTEQRRARRAASSAAPPA